ncbi:hypothetical protein [Synechocystis sp. LKSZ1]|uniref:hypothetical protein n=1 Tax=Synechocystis sp. LKSZ1 TaxID=3144951 RepID=UPI00336BB360
MQPTPPKPPQPAPESPPTEALKAESSQAEAALGGTKLDTSPQNYYQAIGWLRGKLVKDEEERFGVQIRDVTFPLYLPRRVIAVANKLLEQMVWLKCYPQSKGEGLSFKAVWMGSEQTEKGEPGIFVLRGVWQFIPQCRRPVFSIYRNELKNYENRPTNQHLPLIWADQTPYRFRKDSEERPKFYQIIARLIPQRGCFGFVAQITDPIEQTPKRVKKPPLAPPAGTGKTPKPKPATKSETAESIDSETNPFPPEDLSPTSEVAPGLLEDVVTPTETTALPSVEELETSALSLEAPVAPTEALEEVAPATTPIEAEAVELVTDPNSEPSDVVGTAANLDVSPPENTSEPGPEDNSAAESAPSTKAKRSSKSTTKNTTKAKTSRKKSTS